MTNLAALPSLDQLANDPAKASTLPPEVAVALLAKIATLNAVLLVSALAQASTHAAPPEGDRLLTPAEAAKRLATTVDWLYRHARKLPFTVRSGRHVRFSSKGIERYIRERQGS
jgi:excisionase family DNA binding protein